MDLKAFFGGIPDENVSKGDLFKSMDSREALFSIDCADAQKY